MTSNIQTIVRKSAQQEADHLLHAAQLLEGMARLLRADAAALRAHARPGGCKPGESGLLPGWGYSYARSRLAQLQNLTKGWPT